MGEEKNKNMKTSKIIPSKISEAGYIKIELSTKGKFGAPPVFHMRNFDTTDILKLALTEDETLPKKVADVLNSLIEEDDVNILDFHEKEVIETLIRLYKSFFATKLKNIDFVWNDDDLEFLKQKYKNDPQFYQNLIYDLKNGIWKPKFDIDLDLLETYDIDDNIKTDITVKNTKTGFYCVFTWPRFGDTLLLKEFIDKKFQQQDKQFQRIKELYQFRKKEEERFKKGEEVNLLKLPEISKEDKEKLIEYETEKATFSAYALKALYLRNFNGEDLSETTLQERLKFAEDPRLDLNMMRKVSEFYDSLKIGVIENIQIFNPIKEVVEFRNYRFRLVDLFQAIRLYEADEYVIDTE